MAPLRWLVALWPLCASLFMVPALSMTDARRCETSKYEAKTRVFVSTDIGNEPDDQMSFVRFLTYSNEFQVEGIAATTSTWLRNVTNIQQIEDILTAYGQVVDNLNANVPADGMYPTVEYLRSIVATSHPVYGMQTFRYNLSTAATSLINAVDASDDPLWMVVWGGTLVLAETLAHVRSTRTESQLADFVSKLRVYAISDQDDTGPWIRWNFPKLFYIVSVHGFNYYNVAAWSGISGEVLYAFDVGGPDTSLVSQQWLQDNIRKGPLGARYLHYAYIMEGDTPSFLYLIPNGLGSPEYPDYGSWGGRYTLVDRSNSTLVHSDAVDSEVLGVNHQNFTSNHATIWRWRRAYQYDFAARINWTLTANPNTTNHAPVPVLNDTCGPSAWTVPFAGAGSNITIDASASWDPDSGDSLSFDWQLYRDPNRMLADSGSRTPNVSLLTTTYLNDEKSMVTFTPLFNTTYHILLTLSDAPHAQPLLTYRRIILQPPNDVIFATGDL